MCAAPGRRRKSASTRNTWRCSPAGRRGRWGSTPTATTTGTVSAATSCRCRVPARAMTGGIAMTDLLDDFLVRAVLGGVGVALIAGPLGAFVVWRRMAYFGATLAHTSLLGVPLGLAPGLDVNA